MCSPLRGRFVPQDQALRTQRPADPCTAMDQEPHAAEPGREQFTINIK